MEESTRSLESLLHMCFSRAPSDEELYTMLGYNASVPPSVRQALFSRVFDNDDLLPTIRKPVLITHGADDAIVRRTVVDQHRSVLHRAEVDIMSSAGHAPFRDDPESFNRRLAAFANEVAERRLIAQSVPTAKRTPTFSGG